MTPERHHPPISPRLLPVLAHVAVFLLSVASLAPIATFGDELRLADELRVQARSQKTVQFTVSRTDDAPHHVLSFAARLDAPRRGGYTYALRLRLNGEIIRINRLLNRLPYEERVDGTVKTVAIAGGEVFAVDYSNDIPERDEHPTYALKSGRNNFMFLFDITELVRPGANELVIENIIPSPLENPLVIVDLRIQHSARVERPDRRDGRPLLPLPRWTVQSHAASSGVTFAAGDDRSVTVRLADGTAFVCRSRFSTPDGEWTSGSSPYFRHSRAVRQTGEAIVVTDRFTNLTDGDLPLMQRHEIAPGGDRQQSRWQRFWVAGLNPSTTSLTQTEPANPTVFGTTSTAGIGLLPLNDEFLVHVRTTGSPASLVLEDPHFVLRKGATYTAEWAIVPVERDRVQRPWGENAEDVWDKTNEPYFSFVNAVRRLRGVQFTLLGAFAFLRADPRYTGKWSDEEIREFVRYKAAKMLCSSIDYPRYMGRYPHGTAFQLIDHSYRVQHIRRLRRLVPDVKHLVYFHCYIDVRDDAPTLFADSRLLLANGEQATYGRGYDRLFIPFDGSSYQPAVAQNVDIILDEIHADGVYWDEMEYSRYRYHYGAPWDGVSGDIHPRTHRLIRKKASVELLTQRWRKAMATRILKRGPLVANGQPHTRSMLELKFPRFVETGSISNCRRAQLFSPIALGDHLTERSEEDAYRVMLRALDFGCLYYWYNDLLVRPTHEHLTSYMYPCTPVELHEGVVLGRERIITNRDGIYTWGDDSPHEVHVFGADSRELEPSASKRHARTYTEGGVTYTHLVLPPGGSAAILRR